jgi:hypothetical protein
MKIESKQAETRPFRIHGPAGRRKLMSFFEHGRQRLASRWLLSSLSPVSISTLFSTPPAMICWLNCVVVVPESLDV